MRRSLPLVLGALVALSACDSAGPVPESPNVAATPAASMVPGEIQISLDRTATTSTTKIYLISEFETIACHTYNAVYSGGRYLIRAYNEDNDSPNVHCDGKIDYGPTYLVATGNTNNAVTFSLPIPGQGSGDFNLSLNGATWSTPFKSASSDATVVSRDVGFTIPSGLYSTSEYHSFWDAYWTAGGTAYDLPFDVDVEVDLQYVNGNGYTTTLTVFDGVGGYTDGSWSAQGGTNGTISVTDERGNDTTTGSFYVTPDSGGGGGGPDKCFPGGINWPACDA